MGKSNTPPKPMGKAAKAALFSALIFPGAGLWWLKHYWRACIFIIPTGLILLHMFRLLWQLMAPIQRKLMDQVEMGLINPLDIGGLYLRLYKEIFVALEAHQAQLEFAKYTLIICWLCSIVSSYSLGKKIEQTEAQTLTEKSKA